jgi:hypothetical protein
LRESRGEPVGPEERPEIRHRGCSALVFHVLL